MRQVICYKPVPKNYLSLKITLSPNFGVDAKVLGEGLEPSRLTAPEPKSGVSANFTTRALI